MAETLDTLMTEVLTSDEPETGATMPVGRLLVDGLERGTLAPEELTLEILLPEDRLITDELMVDAPD